MILRIIYIFFIVTLSGCSSCYRQPAPMKIYEVIYENKEEGPWKLIEDSIDLDESELDTTPTYQQTVYSCQVVKKMNDNHKGPADV